MVNSNLLKGNSLEKTSLPKISPRNDNIIIPGYYNEQKTDLSITQDFLSKHSLLVGQTGSGKTNVLNFFIKHIKQKMTQNDVMIIFDTKGDFIEKFYKSGDVIVSNSKKYYKCSSKWNIYKEITVDGWAENDLYNNTHEITRSFFMEAVKKSGHPFFPNAARDLLASIILAQLYMGKDSLEFKRKYFNNRELKKYLDRLTPSRIINLLSSEKFADLSAVLSYIGDGTSEQSLGVIAELQNVIRQILIGDFAEEGGLSIRNFVREKGARTLFIEYDLSIGNLLAPIYRLLFDLALKEALGRNKTEGNVYLICDEFKLLPNLQHIEDGVNFGRSLGLKIFAGIQSIEQLYEIYGESKAKNIIAGFSSIYAFKTNDSLTRNFISDLYGKNIVLEQYKTSNNTIVEEKREGKTVEDWEINNLKVGEAIIGLPFEKPFKFKFDLYKG